MDFKVAGTSEFVTAIQLDMKVTGLPGDVLAGALQQATEARFKILDVMRSGDPRAARRGQPEGAADPHDPDPGRQDRRGDRAQGQADQRDHRADRRRHRHPGRRHGVHRLREGGEGADEAARMIDEIANPRPMLVGEPFDGTVVKTTTFGAFVNLVPGRDGLVHISKLGTRQASLERRGGGQGGRHDRGRGRGHRLAGKISLKPIGEEWAIPEGQADESGGGRRDSGDRGGRGGGGRDRGDRGGSGGGGGRDRDRDRGRRFRDDRPGGQGGDAPVAEAPAGDAPSAE